MIDYLNTTRSLNIISLEDPIEFVHRSKTSQIIQRELGTHLPSFAEGRPRRHARGSGRDPGRRIARRGDDLHGDDRRGDRSSGARHPAHDQRHEDHRPHDRRPAHRGARTDQELPGAEPDRGDHPGARQEPGSARAARDLRGHGGHQGHRQTDHDRPVAPDPEPAADGQGLRHAAAGPGAARGHQRQGGGPGRRLCLRGRQAPVPAFRHRHGRTPRPRNCRAPHGRHRRLFDPGGRAQGFGPALSRRRSGAHPPVRRIVAPERRAARGRDGQEGAVRDHAEDRRGALRSEGRHRFRLQPAGRGPLPGQRHAPAERHGRRIPRHSLEGPHHGRIESAGGGAQSRPGQQRSDPGHRQDRLGQVDHARRHDRRHQHAREGPYPDHRGSDRIRAPAQELPDQPARDRRARHILLLGAAVGLARGSRTSSWSASCATWRP